MATVYYLHLVACAEYKNGPASDYYIVEERDRKIQNYDAKTLE